MFQEGMFGGGPQTGNGFTTPDINQQRSNLTGNPQIQAAAMPSFDIGALNSTAVQNPNIANMVKALKGGMQ